MGNYFCGEGLIASMVFDENDIIDNIFELDIKIKFLLLDIFYFECEL